jgi:hypothetical protein
LPIAAPPAAPAKPLANAWEFVNTNPHAKVATPIEIFAHFMEAPRRFGDSELRLTTAAQSSHQMNA